jgi:flagellar hook-associated protein 2
MATSSVSNASGLSGSGTLSSAGIGSGLDVNGIVSKLMALERRPIDLIDSKTTTIQAELSAYGTLKGSLSSLQTSVQSLTSSSTYTATKTTVADTTQFTATSDSTAAPGNYSVQVVKLAKAEKLQSAAFANGAATVGSGTLTFDFGTYSTSSGITSFAPNTAKKSVTVTIPSGSDSLNAVADAINNAKAGISATVINDGVSSYLSFSSLDPGTANSLRILVSDDDGNNTNASGLSRLAFDKSTAYASGSFNYSATNTVTIDSGGPNNQFMLSVDGGAAVPVTIANGTYDNTTIVAAVQAGLTGAGINNQVTVSLNSSNQLVIASNQSGTGYASVAVSGVSGNAGLTALFGSTTTSLDAARNMTEAVTPQDAQLIVDGVTVNKSTNTVTDAIRGVTLSLVKESTTSTTVSVTSDNSALSSALDAFVKAYNTTSTMLSDLLSYDAKTGKAGALQGEGTVRSIQAGLRTALQTLTQGTGLNGLSDIGISFQRDGSLAFNSAKLTTALSDPTKNVRALLTGSDRTRTTDGIANKLNNLLYTFLLSDGTLTSRTNGLTQDLSSYAKNRSSLEVRMTAIEARYRKQYSDLDTLMANMTKTSSFLTQQLANLPSIGGSSK